MSRPPSRVGRRALGALSALLSACASTPLGAPSDHLDGHRFRNPEPFESRGLMDVLRWKLGGSPAQPWPDFVPIEPAPPPPARVTEGLRVTYVNHATVLVQVAGLNLLTDPVWSDVVGPGGGIGQRRRKPPGLRFDDLPAIDVVLLSHDHYDHLDLPTLRRLKARDAPRVLAGLGTAVWLADQGLPGAVDLDWWQSVSVGPARITFTPARHASRRGAFDGDQRLWGGFQVEAQGQRVFFAGDTGMGSHFADIRERLGPPTLALLPIGAYLPRWFMQPQHIDPDEAVAAHRALGAQHSLAIHWGTFRQADEGMNDPVQALARALDAQHPPTLDFRALDNGGSWSLHPGSALPSVTRPAAAAPVLPRPQAPGVTAAPGLTPGPG
jgi:L-ascorbate metabolism protein UlaG (beta-lactamase superfamily)